MADHAAPKGPEEDSGDSDSETSEDGVEPEFQWQRRIATANHEQINENTLLPSPKSPQVDTKKSGPASRISTEPLSLFDLNDAEGFFRHHGEPRVPVVPTTDRSIEELLDDFDMWNMSLQERQKLTEHWEVQVREALYSTHRERFDRLSAEHGRLRSKQKDEDEEVRIRLFPLIHTVLIPPNELGKTADFAGC